MRNTYTFLYAFAPIMFLIVSSCTKSDDLLTEDNQIKETDVHFRSIGDNFTIDSVDGYLAIELSSYIGSCTYNELRAWGSFNDKQDYAGSLSVEGFQLDTLWDGNEVRYLKYIETSDYNIDQLSTANSVQTTFQSTMQNTYYSFSKSFSYPSSLCVNTSIGTSGVLSKNSDLTISWDPDSNTETLYVAICTPGEKCVYKEFSDTGNGNAVISSGEFPNFDSGDNAYLYIGRGIGSIIEQSNGTKIGVLRIQWSNYPGLKVE